MKSSLGLLAGLISAVSLVAGVSYPAIAQTNSNPNLYNQNRGQQQPSVMVPNSTDSLSISSIVNTSPSFEMFNSLLQVAGLNNTALAGQLDSDESDYIVYAPTDEAFAALPEGTIKMLVQPENRDLLVQILSSHIRPMEGDNLSASANVPDANGVISVPETRVEDRDSPSRVDDMAQNSGSNTRLEDNGFNSSDSSMSSSSQASNRNPDSVGVPDANGVIEVPETRVEDRDSPSRVDDMAQTDRPNSSDDSMTSMDRNRPSVNSNNRIGNPGFSNAQVIGSGIQANNGVIYAIDQVLIPGNVGTELGLSGTGEVLTPAF